MLARTREVKVGVSIVPAWNAPLPQYPAPTPLSRKPQPCSVYVRLDSAKRFQQARIRSRYSVGLFCSPKVRHCEWPPEVRCHLHRCHDPATRRDAESGNRMAPLSISTRDTSELASFLSLQSIAVFASLGSMAPRTTLRRCSSLPQNPSAVMGIKKDLHQRNINDNARMPSI